LPNIMYLQPSNTPYLIIAIITLYKSYLGW